MARRHSEKRERERERREEEREERRDVIMRRHGTTPQ